MVKLPASITKDQRFEPVSGNDHVYPHHTSISFYSLRSEQKSA
jgi:hypothetical protein